MRKYYLWVAFLIGLWAIPSFVLYSGISTYLSVRNDKLSQQSFLELSNQLESFSEKCSIQYYFQSKLSILFSDLNQSASKNTGNESPANISSKFLSDFPNGLIDVFIFDKGLNILNNRGNHNSDAARLILSKTLQKPGTVYSATFHEERIMQELLPHPGSAIKRLKYNKEKLISLGGQAKSSHGYLHPGENLGVFALINSNTVEADFFIKTAIQELSESRLSFGYLLQYGKSLKPENLTPEELKKAAEDFCSGHSEKFVLKNCLLLIKRLDNNSILFCTSVKVESHKIFLSIILLFYLTASVIFIKYSYNREILNSMPFFSIEYRFAGYFILTFGFFFAAAISVSYLFYIEEFENLLQKEYSETLNCLHKIDIGFEKFLEEKLVHYNKISENLDKVAVSLPNIKMILADSYAKCDFDNLFILASSAERISNSISLPCEMRKFLFRPLDEKRKQMESLLERESTPAKYQIDLYYSENLNPSNFAEYILFGKHPAVPEDTEKLISTFVYKTGAEALKDYDSARGFPVIAREKLSDLTIDGLFSEETTAFMRATRNKMNEFINIETNNEHWIYYYHIIPGPDKRAWYFVFLFHNLPTLEQQYLEHVFQNKPEYLLSGNLSAVSSFKRVQNFPDIFEYKKHSNLLTRLSEFKTKITEYQQTNGDNYYVSAIRCNFLKNYILLFKQPGRIFEKKIRNLEIILFISLFSLGVIGLFLALTMLKRIIQPFSQIFHEIKKLEGKDFNSKLTISSNNEFGQLAFSFNKAVKILEAMEISKVFQDNIFPSKPLLNGDFKFSGVNRMCHTLGGDYFDYFEITPNKTAVILGDVSGHGISAAVVVAMAKAAFLILVPKFHEQPSKVLEKINRLFFELLNKKKMMTCFLGILDSSTGKMLYSNAGQSYPLLINNNGVTMSRMPSNPLGIRIKATFSTNETDLSDCRFMLYSDGCVEAGNSNEGMFGYEMLLKTVSENRNLSGETLLRKIIEEVETFTGSKAFEDDLTLVLVEKSEE
ncbi:MAG: SpoIIE family protein phosphatase [Candidatus Riflebacteria bacterium]|nr:SpoIIE family protein phosphatase [Candidatus Riflebacteria bacterium]